MSRRMWALAVSGWVVVVIAGSALTWVAIERAGREVTTDPAAGETQPAVVGTIGGPPTPSPTSAATPARPGSPTTTPTPSRTSSSPSSGPSVARSSAPAPRTTSAPATRTQTRTWSGTPGSVTVSCTGRTVRFLGASPADGWRVERGDDSGDEVEVKFERSEAETKVRATCGGNGVPVFRVEVGGGSSSDD